MRIRLFQSWSLTGLAFISPYLSLVFLLLLTGCEPDKNRLKVAVAANLYFAIQEVAEDFEQRTGTKILLSTASSGSLTTQIRNGAPFHLFISADLAFPATLHQLGLTIGPPQPLVEGNPVLWSRTAFESPRELFSSATVKQIAIANPELAPYGGVSRAWLMTQGYWDSVQIKLVYGNNIGQVNQYIRSSVVDAALTAGSARFAEPLREKGHWYPLEGIGSITHGMALIQPHPDLENWLHFLQSPIAQAIFEKYGYSLPQRP